MRKVLLVALLSLLTSSCATVRFSDELKRDLPKLGQIEGKTLDPRWIKTIHEGMVDQFGQAYVEANLITAPVGNEKFWVIKLTNYFKLDFPEYARIEGRIITAAELVEVRANVIAIIGKDFADQHIQISRTSPEVIAEAVACGVFWLINPLVLGYHFYRKAELEEPDQRLILDHVTKVHSWGQGLIHGSPAYARR